MKKLFLTLFFANMLLLNTGCGDSYDDSALRGRVDNLEDRIAKLEELCKQMNTNISSLQTLVTALQDNDHITAVTPINKDGKVIGYTITFKKSTPITIYNGKDGTAGADGKDATPPVIGVAKFSDVYYWTIDGDWLTDGSGNKIKAEGSDGKDGVTPQLKIENGDWYTSTDGGKSWNKMGQATGDKGDSMFTDVTESDSEVVFTLADGTTITIPKVTIPTPLGIVFSGADLEMLPGKTYEIGYTISGADANTTIDVLAQNGYRADVVKTDFKSGKIVITAPVPASDDRIIVLVSDGGERTLMRFINIAESVIIVTTDSYAVEQAGGTQAVEVETNIDFSVFIAEEDRSWVQLLETRTPHFMKTLTFSFQPNPDTKYRYATIELRDAKGNVGRSIFFTQKPWGYKYVTVTTPGTLESLIPADEKDRLTGLDLTGTLDDADFAFLRTMPALRSVELSKITNTTLPEACFQQLPLELVVLPAKLTAIPNRAFDQSQIRSISIPATVTSIGFSAFSTCNSLSGELILPSKLQSIGASAFAAGPRFSGNLVIPNSVTEIGTSAFLNNKFTGTLTLSEELTVIASNCFYGCSGFTGDLIIPESVTTIEGWAFYNCTGFRGELTLGSNISDIGFQAFCKSVNYTVGPLNFAKVYCKATTPPYVDSAWGQGIASGDKYQYLGVPASALSQYQSRDSWRFSFTKIEAVEF